jgi:hypothetical protein
MVTGVFFSSPVLVIAGSCWLLSVELQGADHLSGRRLDERPGKPDLPLLYCFGDDAA